MAPGMFIDTANANSRSARPRTVIAPESRTSPYNESSTPLLETFVGQEAPPTYLEATTPGLYSARLSDDQGARLLAEGDREAGDAAVKEDKYRRKGLRQWTAKWWVRWAAALVFITLLAIFLAAIAAAVTVKVDKSASVTTPQAPTQSASSEKIDPPTFAQPAFEEESALADGYIGDDKDRPDLIAIPWPTPTPSGPRPPSPTQSREVFPIRWQESCGKQYNVKVEEYDFGATKELNIQEALHQSDGAYKRVSGWIHVVRAPVTQAPGTIQARLSYAVSSGVNMNSIKHTSSATGLTIGDPSYADGFDGIGKKMHCLGMSLVIYMSAGVAIDTLKVDVTHLGMQIHQGVDFSVTNSTHISLTKSSLDAARFNSRETYLKTISGSISGMYALHDLVSVEAKSGSINIDIEPQPAVAGSSQSAIFMVNAVSSSVRTDFKRKHIPNRDYQVYINTTVGSVDGRFIHGSKTEINSIAGFVNADLLPYKSGDYVSEISTQTDSGQTSVKVRAPYHAKGKPMTGLYGIHRTVSGELDLTYPQEWMGKVNGTSLSGALHLQGADVELLEEIAEPQKNHVEAKKGDAGGRIYFDSSSGACEIKIGKT
ncbi:hypothetical protein FB567DRAFT_531254 [Paraphoma chrysanthemicola]|uniref:Adhesin domain-containing protein n=1 Tax=Paraphoma chrysanthemicola TaxID=798071 RepID=A0A8K0R1T9_9PLEO|nr:hypothetical protein FB567DRAFT_531254 [Paraphoma chrysanthemicola]